MRTGILRAVPVLGWLFLAYGAIREMRGNPLRHRGLRTIWWIDAFLSVVVHSAQIPAAMRTGDELGHSRPRTALLTFVFGLTWWRTLPQVPTTDSRANQEIG